MNTFLTSRFLTSRRDGDARYRRTLAAAATALLLLAPAVSAEHMVDTAMVDTATSQRQQQNETPREQQKDEQQTKDEQQKEAESNVLERKALAAHQESDTGPVENWFGCPPKRDPNATGIPDSEVRAASTGETERGADACDPDAPANDSPQKTDSKY